MLGTPCVTVRRNTERGVTVEAGSNRLAPAEQDRILAALAAALTATREWKRPERWDASVSSRVVEALADGIVPLVGTGS